MLSILVIILILLAISSFGLRLSQVWRKRERKFALAKLVPIQPLNDFAWENEEPRKLRPYKPVYNITMGIQSDNISDLITVDREYLDRVTARRGIVASYNKTVHGCVPGGEAAVRELYEYLLGHHLPTRFPSMFKVNEKGMFENLATAAKFSVDAPREPEACLKILAETIEEDIFLLKETETTHVCLAFVCCFPAGFDPSQKLGRDMKAIHGPVPSYEKIGPSMERYFRKLEVAKSVKRVNWGVQSHNNLINISGNHIKNGDDFVLDEEIDCLKSNLRCELQSLTRLPESKFVLFCFKTYLYPLSEIKAEGSGPALADAIEGLKTGNAPGMFKYKSAVRWGKSIQEYLRG